MPQQPFDIFNQWYNEAEKAGVVEPFAFVLSTVSPQGEPRSRVVLWRRLVKNVFYFFTNYSSDKGRELQEAQCAAMNFHWRHPYHRQVRIQGRVKKASAEISNEYFSTRPRGSQIGAWASPQSRPISGREELESLVSSFEDQFKGQEVPRPEFWGGFGIEPTYFEFWQEGESRLHTRLVFEQDQGHWVQKTIAP